MAREGGVGEDFVELRLIAVVRGPGGVLGGDDVAAAADRRFVDTELGGERVVARLGTTARRRKSRWSERYVGLDVFGGLVEAVLGDLVGEVT